MPNVFAVRVLHDLVGFDQCATYKRLSRIILGHGIERLAHAAPELVRLWKLRPIHIWNRRELGVHDGLLFIQHILLKVASLFELHYGIIHDGLHGFGNVYFQQDRRVVQQCVCNISEHIILELAAQLHWYWSNGHGCLNLPRLHFFFSSSCSWTRKRLPPWRRR